ncbi:MAG: hypothetical protein FJ149_00365 [Euryarchaeota archaeon]|nr:hypothetical protein [Euryarchaeota archaeon]
MARESRDDAGEAMRSRGQLAALAASCLLLSLVAGMLPDGTVPAAYRTGGWIFFAVMALGVMYFAFPHTWIYALWLGGIWGATVIGLQLILLGGERLFQRYWAAAGIGLLMELAALFLVYTLILRIRVARTVLESRAPLGLWLLAVVSFFLLAVISGAGLALWSSGGSTAALGVYGATEALLALATVYICWAPEEAVWARRERAPAPGVAVADTVQAGLLKIVGPRREPPAPEKCPSCGARLGRGRLRCPSCGQHSEHPWCAVSESFVVACPSCRSPTLSVEGKCIACGAPVSGILCPSCKKTSPAREWRQAG